MFFNFLFVFGFCFQFLIFSQRQIPDKDNEGNSQNKQLMEGVQKNPWLAYSLINEENVMIFVTTLMLIFLS